MSESPNEFSKEINNKTIRIDITQSAPAIGATSVAALIAQKLREILPELEISVVSAESDFGKRSQHLHQHPNDVVENVRADRVRIYDHCARGISPDLGLVSNGGTATLISKASDAGKLHLS